MKIILWTSTKKINIIAEKSLSLPRFLKGVDLRPQKFYLRKINKIKFGSAVNFSHK
jgi:hypothetical protein